ncbi:LOW QUALITY PROTEIN: acetylcholine receptor subunit beta-type unc-29-like [Aphomia sociella]
MAWLIHSTFLSLICLTIAKDCVIDNRSVQNSWEEQLHNDLKCHYQNGIPPDGNNTEVRIKFIMKYFNFDSTEEIFKVYSWIFLFWTDKRLRWNDTNYDGITETIVKSSSIWSPSLRLLNEVDWQDYEPYFGHCTIDSSGDVFCLPRVTHEALCNTKLANWPFDIQKCTLEFGAWTKYNKIRFMFSSSRSVTVLGAEYGADWTIIDYKQEERVDDDIQLRLTFFLERISAGHAAIAVVPTILLSMLTLTSLSLEVKDNVRLGVVTFNLLCHFYLLSSINEIIPKHSIDTPSILLYLRSSLLVTAIVIVLTTFLSHLKKRRSPPMFVISVNDFVLNGRGKFIIKPRWVAEHGITVSDDTDNKTLEHWTDFANIINSVCHFVVIVFYIVIISVYMPRPSLTTVNTNITDPDVFKFI